MWLFLVNELTFGDIQDTGSHLYFQFTGGEGKAKGMIRTHFLMFPSLSHKLLLLLLVALEAPPVFVTTEDSN